MHGRSIDGNAGNGCVLIKQTSHCWGTTVLKQMSALIVPHIDDSFQALAQLCIPDGTTAILYIW